MVEALIESMEDFILCHKFLKNEEKKGNLFLIFQTKIRSANTHHASYQMHWSVYFPKKGHGRGGWSLYHPGVFRVSKSVMGSQEIKCAHNTL